jgi:hypothetical protein
MSDHLSSKSVLSLITFSTQGSMGVEVALHQVNPYIVIYKPPFGFETSKDKISQSIRIGLQILERWFKG